MVLNISVLCILYIMYQWYLVEFFSNLNDFVYFILLLLYPLEEFVMMLHKWFTIIRLFHLPGIFIPWYWCLYGKLTMFLANISKIWRKVVRRVNRSTRSKSTLLCLCYNPYFQREWANLKQVLGSFRVLCCLIIFWLHLWMISRIFFWSSIITASKSVQFIICFICEPLKIPADILALNNFGNNEQIKSKVSPCC